MPHLSDIVKMDHVLITIPGYVTSPELLRAVVLYRHLERNGLKPVFYVHGDIANYVDELLKELKIKPLKELVLESPFIIEIKGGLEKIHSVKVDKVGDKLKLLLLPKKNALTASEVNVVGINLPYSHIVALGNPNYVEKLFEGVSFSNISVLSEYGQSEYNTISMEDFVEIIALEHDFTKEGVLKKYLDLDTYNEFVEFFLTGNKTVDLLKVREALIDDVLAWGRKDYSNALSNWQEKNNFIVGKIRIDLAGFVPSMPMWADFVYLAETRLRLPVVTFVQFGDYVYTRVISPAQLPNKLQDLGFWVRDNIAESINKVDKLEEWTEQVLKVLRHVKIDKKDKTVTAKQDSLQNIVNTQDKIIDIAEQAIFVSDKEEGKQPVDAQKANSGYVENRADKQTILSVNLEEKEDSKEDPYTTDRVEESEQLANSVLDNSEAEAQNKNSSSSRFSKKSLKEVLSSVSKLGAGSKKLVKPKKIAESEEPDGILEIVKQVQDSENAGQKGTSDKSDKTTDIQEVSKDAESSKQDNDSELDVDELAEKIKQTLDL